MFPGITSFLSTQFSFQTGRNVSFVSFSVPSSQKGLSCHFFKVKRRIYTSFSNPFLPLTAEPGCFCDPSFAMGLHSITEMFSLWSWTALLGERGAVACSHEFSHLSSSDLTLLLPHKTGEQHTKLCLVLERRNQKEASLGGSFKLLNPRQKNTSAARAIPKDWDLSGLPRYVQGGWSLCTVIMGCI